MKKEDIQTKIDVIFNNLDKLKFFKTKSFEEFISDFRNSVQLYDNRRYEPLSV